MHLTDFEQAANLPVYIREGGWIVKGLRINKDQKATIFNGRVIDLSLTQQLILEHVFELRGQVTLYEDLSHIGTKRVIVISMSEIRRKLLASGYTEELLETVRNVGIRLTQAAQGKVVNYLPALVPPVKVSEDTYLLGDWGFTLQKQLIVSYKGQTKIMPPASKKVLLFLAVNQGKTVDLNILRPGGIKAARRYMSARLCLLRQELGNEVFSKHIRVVLGLSPVFYPYPFQEGE